MKEFKCKKCGSSEVFLSREGTHLGIYCGSCGSWIKWANREEQRLVELQIQKAPKKSSDQLAAEYWKERFLRLSGYNATRKAEIRNQVVDEVWEALNRINLASGGNLWLFKQEDLASNLDRIRDCGKSTDGV